MLRLAMSRTVWAVSEAKSSAPATGLVTVPTRPFPRPEKKPLTPPSVFTPSTVDVMMLVIPPMMPGEGGGRGEGGRRGERERAREREREREDRERAREREDRQTDRQTDRERESIH